MGRPASERARQRALQAAAELIGERGIEGLTVDEVATRSGVARTTIYRRWPNRHELALEAIRACKPALRTPDTGDLRADLLEVFAEIAEASTDPKVAPLMTALLHHAATDPEFEQLHRAFLEEHQRPVATVLSLARARGDLPAGLDVDFAVDLLVGPLLSRILFRRVAISRQDLEAVIDCVTTGLRAGCACGRGDAAPAAAP